MCCSVYVVCVTITQTERNMSQTGRIRMTAPLVTPEYAERIREAAAMEGRSISNLVSRAACLYADHVLSTVSIQLPIEQGGD